MVQISRADAPANTFPAEVSSEIWADAQEQSVVMQRARRVNLPGSGVAVPIVTGDPEAAFVGETEAKPVSYGTLDSKLMRPYKIAVIEPFSMEFRRDLPTLYSALRSRLGGAIAKTFDLAALHGIGRPSGGEFDDLAGVTEVPVGGNVYDQFLTAIETVDDLGGDLSAWLLSGKGEVLVLRAKDGNGRPLFTANPANDGSIGAVLGRPVHKSKRAGVTGTPNVVGIAGDWSTAAWGAVNSISYSVSDQATLVDGENTINLWQQNMFAVRAEIEVGFRVRDDGGARFVRLTDADPTAA